MLLSAGLYRRARDYGAALQQLEQYIRVEVSEEACGAAYFERAELYVQFHSGRARAQSREHDQTPDHSCFSSCKLMVPIVIVMRTRICTGRRRRSSDTQTLTWAER